jgi:hypothetical protein
MRIPRWSKPIAVTALFLASVGLTMSANAQAAAVPHTAHTPHIAVSIPNPLRFPSHATSHGLKNVEYSGNWGGYADTGTTFTSVTTTWTQPSTTCGSSTTYAAFWDGLDGYSSGTVEQTGTLVECYGGAAYYYAWYEMYPAGLVTYSSTVRPGDSFTATTSYSGGTYTLTLKNNTEGWTDTHTAGGSYARSSAEVIVEAPSSSSGILPLAHFAPTTFTGSRVNGSAISAFTDHQIDIASSSGSLKETTSGLDSTGTSFTATWDAS